MDDQKWMFHMRMETDPNTSLLCNAYLAVGSIIQKPMRHVSEKEKVISEVEEVVAFLR